MNLYEFSFVILMGFTIIESYLLVMTKSYGLTAIFALIQIFKMLLIAVPIWSIFEKKRISRKFLLITLIFSIMIAISLSKGVLSSVVYKPNVLLSFKNIYLWYFYLLIILFFPVVVKKNTIRLLLIFTFIFSSLSAIYSLWVIINYKGNPDVFYFYKLYSEMNMYTDYNFIRNGIPRAFGFASSSITFSQILLIPFAFSYCYWREKKSLVSIILFVFTIFCMAITQQRNPILAFIISVISFKVFKRTGKFINLIIIDLASALLTFGMLFLAVTMGYLPIWTSTGGRVAQMAMTTSKLIENPLGYGIGSTGLANTMYKFHADLSLFTIGMDLGVLGLIIFYSVIYLLMYKVIKIIRSSQTITINNKYFKSAVIVLNSIVLMTEYGNVFDNSALTISVYCSAIFCYCINIAKSPRKISCSVIVH